MRSATRKLADALFKPYVPPAMDWAAFRQQEIALLVLNIAALLAVIVLPILLTGDSAPLKGIVVIVVYARIVEQLAELFAFILRRKRPSDRFMRTVVHASIWVNVAFAWFAAMINLEPETHFVVLMVIPLIAAAFRVSLLETLAVLAAAVALTFTEIQMTFHSTPVELFEEYFHGSTVSMLFVIVAVMVRLLASHLKRSEQRLRQSLVELEDARDRLVAEENLAAVGRLSSAIAHEIRNPVAMIASSAAMVKEGEGMSRSDFLDIVQREAGRLERLTGDFLSYARPKPPERKYTLMEDSFDYVRSLVSARALEAGVKVELRCAPGLRANVDAFQIHQVLLNLVMNAIDATPGGGTVQLGARSGSGDTTVLWVENSGEQISKEAMASKIFEPFYTTKKGGTGLGLAIARNIVRGHDGMLVLARNEPGHVRFEAAIPNQPRKDENGAHPGR
jgi:signal transduction histidine kinase